MKAELQLLSRVWFVNDGCLTEGIITSKKDTVVYKKFDELLLETNVVKTTLEYDVAYKTYSGAINTSSMLDDDLYTTIEDVLEFLESKAIKL